MTTAQRSTGRNIGALGLIGLGAFFLLVQFGFISFSFFGALWPMFVLLPGLAFVYAALRGGKTRASLMIPGALITGTGLLLGYQNITNHWESWAYAWTLYPVFLGYGLQYLGRRTESPDTSIAGRGFIRWGLGAFVGAAAIFELFIFNSIPFSGVIIPVMLILAGVVMLMRGKQPKSIGKRKSDETPIYTGAAVTNQRKTKRLSASDELRLRIDDALAEEDDDRSVNGIALDPMSEDI